MPGLSKRLCGGKRLDPNTNFDEEVQPGTSPGNPDIAFLYDFATSIPNPMVSDFGSVSMALQDTTVGLSTGKIGKAGSYTKGDGWHRNSSDLLNGTGPWHVCFWAKQTAATLLGEVQGLVRQGDKVAAQFTFSCNLRHTAGIELEVQDNGFIQWPTPRPGFVPSVGSWYWVDFYYESTIAGIAVNNGAYATQTVAPSLGLNGGPFDISSLGGCDSDIDSLMIWTSKRLSQDERDFVYNNGAGWEP